MKKTITLLCALTTFAVGAFAQTKIKDGTVSGSSTLPNSAAVLELESSNKGFLPARVTLTDAKVWGLAGSATSGMIVYNTAAGANGLDSGLVVWKNNSWNNVASKSQADSLYWSLKGNSGINAPSNVGQPIAAGQNFIGTLDAARLALGVRDTARAILDTSGNILGGTSAIADLTGTTVSGNSVLWGRLDTLTNSTGAAVFGYGNVASNNSNYGVLAGKQNHIVNANGALIGGTANIDSSDYVLLVGNANIIGNANGRYSMVGGSQNTVTGTTNIVSGQYNSVAQKFCLVQGQRDTLIGSTGGWNIVGGSSNKITSSTAGYGTSSIVSGYQNTLNNFTNSIVAGSNNTAIGTSVSALFGAQNLDSADYSIVAGSSNIVGSNAANTAVFGNSNTVTANRALVAGSNNFANLPGSVVGGTYNLDSAQSSFVVGYLNTLNTGADYSSLLGRELIASHQYSTVVGLANAEYPGAIFTVGVGGSSSSRANGFVVTNTKTTGATANGLVVLIPSLPTYADDASAASDSSLPSGGLYKIGTAIHIKP